METDYDTGISQIDIDGRKMSLVGKDFHNITSEEGCAMKLCSDKEVSLDDDAHSSEDEEFDDLPRSNQKLDRIERMKREFISLALNVNHDPIKPGERCQLRRKVMEQIQLPVEDTDTVADSYYSEFTNEDGQYKSINKRYESMKDYEAIISKSTSFDQIVPHLVFKRSLQPGYGKSVGENSLVVYNFALWTEVSNEPFDSTWLRRSTVFTDMSKDSVLPGIHALLMSARRGEWCEAFLRPKAAFGSLGAPPRIPRNATVFCLLEVVQVLDSDKIARFCRDPSGMKDVGATFDDLYEAGDEARRRGNYFVEQHHYSAALQRYKSGIRIMEAITYKNEDEEKKGCQLLVKLYNNCARAANANADPRLALAACKQAGLLNNMCPKTHWNRMCAWKRKGHTDRALGIARRAMQLFPEKATYTSFKREADDLCKRLREERHEVDALHRLMGRALLS